MRIKKISIKGLFDTFNHEITLKDYDNVTIIHGPNGYGKTSILRLINGLFNGNLSELKIIPFKEFVIDFDNNKTLTVIQKKIEVEKEGILYSVKYLNFIHNIPDLHLPESYSLISPNESKNLENKFLESYDKESFGVFHIGKSYIWHDRIKGDLVDFDIIIDRYPELFRFEIRRDLSQIKSRIKTQLKKILYVYFIKSQRLLKREVEISKLWREVKKIQTFLTVLKYSSELSELIQTYIGKYAELSQSLDRTFPARLIQGTSERKLYYQPTESEIKNRMEKLEYTISRLIDVGLIDQSETMLLPKTKLEEYTKRVLSFYFNDIEKKLEIFDIIAEKLELLKNILNSLFLFKRLIIDKDRGFLFENLNGVILDPSKLSSGEQNQLILYYELLFKSQQNSLILIDEPEVSLHIAWQKQILKNLIKIAKIGDLNIIISTHSPQIIHNRWDLTVELKGP